ncbi:MAG: hypothetical protein QOJ16_3841 [Acidobacteriota bacterium]|jgi:hypothetical protein|nr:hypothetical protein [Acidobacteriota bacterium]
MERGERFDLVFKRLSIVLGGIGFLVGLWVMAGFAHVAGGGSANWFFSLCIATILGAIPFYVIRGLHWILRPIWSGGAPAAPNLGARSDL